MDPETASAPAIEAPAPFSLESAFAEASKTGGEEPPAAAPPKTDAPTDTESPDSKTDAAPKAEATGEQPGEEPGKSNRQAGREAYERGLREGREQAQRDADARIATERSEQANTARQRELETLLTEANLPDDGNFETSQKRQEAQRKLGQLYASNTVTQTAYQRGRADQEAVFWNGFENKLSGEIGLDDAGVTALMREAKSGLDFAKRLVDHGKTQEKSVWEPEIAKRDATIEQLRGQLAGKSPSPEAANGLRTNGAATFDGSWESAFRLAQAAS